MLSMILGFVSSTVPEVFKFLNKKTDQKHELALLDKQLEIQKMIEQERTQQVTIQGNTDMYVADNSLLEAAINAQTEAVKVDGVYNWVKSLNAAVRPLMGMAVVMVIWTGLVAVFIPSVAASFNAMLGVPLIVELVLYIAGYFLGSRSISKMNK